MKNLIPVILISVTLLFTSSVFANNADPLTDKNRILKVDLDAYSLDIASKDDIYFNSIYHCTVVNKICFRAKAEIEFVQITDMNDEVVMMLPIESQIMHLSTDQLEVGTYNVNVLIKGVENPINTHITKK